jgi:hypothetical protein
MQQKCSATAAAPTSGAHGIAYSDSPGKQHWNGKPTQLRNIA